MPASTPVALVCALALATPPAAMAATPVADPLDPAAHARLAQALSCVNLALDDLGCDKRPVEDRFRLAVVNLGLDRPLTLAPAAARAEADFAGDAAASARAAAGWLDLVPAPPPALAERTRPEAFAGAPREAQELLALLVDARQTAEASRLRALGNLDEGERALVTRDAARLYLDESADVEYDAHALLAAAAKIDRASLATAEITLADAAVLVRARVPSLHPATWKAGAWTVAGVRVELGSTANETHAGADVVLDAGGDDVYRAGSVLVDLAGDDTYRDAAGKALSGTALVLDLAGDDRYLGAHFVQGGTAFGASLLLDVAGDDVYTAAQCAQGAAYFGVGLLLDLAGNDTYRGARFVQGFGGTAGLGSLSDLAGNDLYAAGGRFSHAPLLPHSFQSLSQGFGFGLRGQDASGGVGVLADHAGNDVYAAEVFGQGASYWLALGVLVDSAGNDEYNLYQYGQGAGIHLSSGVLLDREGDDGYTCLNGVAQGSGHDYGTGLLLDLAGNDGYQGSGMSQGGANANAVGMLVDCGGNDSYAGWNIKDQGDSFYARDTIGLGVLLDLGGRDRYTHGGEDGAAWTRGTVGVGLDVEEPR